MASRRGSDDLSIMADDESLTSSPRRARGQPQVTLEAAVKSILDGGLVDQIKSVVQQQAALVFGELSETRDTPTTSRASASEPAAIEMNADVQKSRQAILIGGEIVDRFNLDDKDSSVDRWLNKIDQLGDVHRWWTYDRSTIMQAESARKWYHQLERYDYTWAQWKVLLREALPRRHDFTVMLEEMMARRKMPDEAMTAYYHDKLALCIMMDIKGEHAVSCVIRGLPEELRANAYAADVPHLRRYIINSWRGWSHTTGVRLTVTKVAGRRSARCRLAGRRSGATTAKNSGITSARTAHVPGG